MGRKEEGWKDSMVCKRNIVWRLELAPMVSTALSSSLSWMPIQWRICGSVGMDVRRQRNTIAAFAEKVLHLDFETRGSREAGTGSELKSCPRLGQDDTQRERKVDRAERRIRSVAGRRRSRVLTIGRSISPCPSSAAFVVSGSLFLFFRETEMGKGQEDTKALPPSSALLLCS